MDRANYMLLIILISVISGMLATTDLLTKNLAHMKYHRNDIYLIILATAWSIFISYIILPDQMEIPYEAFIAAIIAIVVVMYLIRTQSFINEVQYIETMIPNHSMGVFVSEKIRAKTKDPEIVELADAIIQTQQTELELMEKILAKYKNV